MFIYSKSKIMLPMVEMKKAIAFHLDYSISILLNACTDTRTYNLGNHFLLPYCDLFCFDGASEFK